MIDPNVFTVVALKEKLRQMNLSTSGNKPELIVRLNQADPSGQWINDIDADTVEVIEGPYGATAVRDARTEIGEPEPTRGQLNGCQREILRPDELIPKKLGIGLIQRENELLRSTTQVTSASNTSAITTQRPKSILSKISLTNLKEVIPAFDGKKGSYQCWKEQLMIVRQMYQLDDNMTKLLLVTKLRGDAAKWFHSAPAHLSLAIDELLIRMEAMCDRREKLLTLRKEFKSRTWQHGETFAEYFREKLILANKIPIDEDEIVNYLLDGIPAKEIKHQAMTQQFPNKETLLKALENVSLGSDQKVQPKIEKQPVVKNVDEASGSAKKIKGDSEINQESKCFNYTVVEHMAAKCPMPKDEKSACFNSLQLEHKSKECPSRDHTESDVAKESPGNKKTDVNSVLVGGTKDFRRDLDYQLTNDSKDFVLNCKLDTLLDTGSLASFIKDIFVPPNLITPILSEDNVCRDLNDSILEAKGRLTVKMALNSKEPKSVSLLVVPAKSMETSVVIGRDILQFFRKENSSDEEADNQVIREILNIDIDDLKSKPQDSLKVNPNVNSEAQTKVKKLFDENYDKPEKPDQPTTDAKVNPLRQDGSLSDTPRSAQFLIIVTSYLVLITGYLIILIILFL